MSSELEDVLKKAYEHEVRDYLSFGFQKDSARLLTSSVRYGIREGLIKKPDVYSDEAFIGEGNGAYIANYYLMTEKGKKYFGLD